MTKKLSITGLVVAAAASSAFAFGAAPAKAACLPSNPSAICATFDPSSVSNVASRTGFNGTATPSSPFNKARVAFRLIGAGITTPISISGISLTGDGILSSLSFSSVSINSTGASWINSAFVALTGGSPTGSLAALNFANSSISFTIPILSGAVNGNTLEARIQYYNNDEDQLLTSGGNFTASVSVTPPPSGVPAPLPIFGAAIAFSYARKLRKAISVSA